MTHFGDGYYIISKFTVMGAPEWCRDRLELMGIDQSQASMASQAPRHQRNGGGHVKKFGDLQKFKFQVSFRKDD